MSTNNINEWRAEFEAWSKREGACNLSLAIGGKCEDGRINATYHYAPTETAWRAFCAALASRPAVEVDERPAGYLTPDNFKKLALGQVSEILPVESGIDGKTPVYFRAALAAKPAMPTPVEVKIERDRVWIVNGKQSFMLAYEAGEGDDPAEMQAYADQLRAALGIGAKPAASEASAESELLDMLGRVHPYAMPTYEFCRAEERLQRPVDLQQPWPVPDQAAIVWRGDLMTLIAELQHKGAAFEDYKRLRATLDASKPAPAGAAKGGNTSDCPECQGYRCVCEEWGKLDPCYKRDSVGQSGPGASPEVDIEAERSYSPTIVDADGLPQAIAAVLRSNGNITDLASLYALIDAWGEDQRLFAVLRQAGKGE